MKPPRRKLQKTENNPTTSQFWLLKSEPDAFSWEMCKSRGPKGEPWTGVRNYLARNNMRAMRLGDLGFFYHSNEGLEVVGIVRVIELAHPDGTDDTGKWECVDVAAVCDLPEPVTLAAVKTNESLARMSLVTSMRLSVQPVTKDEWAEVCRMAGLDPAALASAPLIPSKPASARKRK
jgi:predicted RNA-binding protein with PUA-like domain